MSITFRIILIVVSLLTTVFMIRKIRYSKVQIEDTLFWFFFSLLLIVISIFPEIPTYLSSLIGIASPVNFIFLFIIFILLIKLFYNTLHISQLENKIKTLAQKAAIGQKMVEDEIKSELGSEQLCKTDLDNQ